MSSVASLPGCRVTDVCGHTWLLHEHRASELRLRTIFPAPLCRTPSSDLQNKHNAIGWSQRDSGLESATAILKKKNNTLLFYVYVYVCFACMDVCVPYVCLVLEEVRGGHQMPWDWSCRWFGCLGGSSSAPCNHLYICAWVQNF